MKRNEHKDKELEFQHNKIRFAEIGDACHSFMQAYDWGRVIYKPNISSCYCLTFLPSVTCHGRY